ncbi:MAG: TlpA family protein disulfide reductase [Bacteroidales bacterium]
MKNTFLLFVLLLFGFSGCAQEANLGVDHSAYSKALQLLQQSKKQLPADSQLVEKEYDRVLQAYANVSDSLKKHAPKSRYAGFETKRLINLCFSAESIEELQQKQEKLFEHLGQYHENLAKPDSVNNEVANCIVNSFETHSIWFDDTLLHYVTTAMQQHLNTLKADSWDLARKQKFVNMYAAKYYKRGIVSKAEPVFRHFRRFYQYDTATTERLMLSQDYALFSPEMQPAEKKLSQLFTGKSIIIFVNEESPFHLIYLIKHMRTALQAYPQMPVILLRDASEVSDGYLMALRRNLANPKHYVANLSEKDCETTENYSAFSAQGEDGQLLYATNNPIDFLEWLEKPLAKQRKAQKEQLHKNYEKLQARKKRMENLPKDTSLKYQIKKGQVKVNCRGYWNSEPGLKIKQYAFTQSSQKAPGSEKQMAKLEVFQEKNPIFSVNFISEGKPVEITLASGPQHNFSASFRDKENRAWNRLTNDMDSLMQRSQVYNHLIENYPFSESDFIENIKTHRQNTQKSVSAKIENTGSSLRPLAEMENSIMKLHKTKPAQEITFKDIQRYYPTESFDTIVWNSPLYKTWINQWMAYGAEDMPGAIDEAFGYWKVVPEEAVTDVGQYIWDRLNAMGHFEALVHLDTTWLAGCKDEKNPEIKQRIDGYKRMAPGKKAPNISWKNKGEKMDLYSLKADTIMVVFWSDDCNYCMEKLPELYHQYGESEHVEVVAVAVDKDESSLKAGKKFMPDWHHVLAKEGWEDELVERYNVFGTPETYILDGDFKIIKKSI